MRRRYREALVAEPPHPKTEFCVIVPARNEEELLPSALQALSEQKMLNGAWRSHESYEVILLINNTTDRSMQVAKSFQRLYSSLQLRVIERNFDRSHAHIGHVRRLLMDEACQRLEDLNVSRGLILSTDSDSRVAPNWISRNAEEVSKGADVVGGRIIVSPCEQESLHSATQALYRYDHLYRRLVSWVEDRWDPEPHDPWPRHYHHFGASLAITPEAYRAARRLPPRRFLEDLAFYDALLLRDIRVRHANTVRVFTSARVAGRTRFGLSRQLNDWQDSGKRLHGVRVESARFLEHLFRTRNQLRNLWKCRHEVREVRPEHVSEISRALDMPERALVEAVREARFFGALLRDLRFCERCRAACPPWARLARLADVVDQLKSDFQAEHQRIAPGTRHLEVSNSSP